MGPVGLGIGRLYLGAAAVGACWWYNRGNYRLSRSDFKYMAFSALLFTAPACVIQASVLAQGFGHGFFGTMVAAVPLLTILVSVPMLGAKPTLREMAGVVGGLACTFVLVEDGMNRGMSIGLLALTMSIPLSSALSNTYLKWRLHHVPAAPLTTVLLLVSATALVPLQLSPGLMESLHVGPPPGATMTVSAMLCMITLGVIGNGISTLVFIWLILTRGPLFAGMATYVVPVLALLWGTFDHETITLMQGAAMIGVLGMVALVQTGAKRESDIVEPAAAGDLVTSLPISAEAEQLTVRPSTEIDQTDPLAAPVESQVA